MAPCKAEKSDVVSRGGRTVSSACPLPMDGFLCFPFRGEVAVVRLREVAEDDLLIVGRIIPSSSASLGTNCLRSSTGLSCSCIRFFRIPAMFVAHCHDFPISTRYWWQSFCWSRAVLSSFCATRGPEVAWTPHKRYTVPAEKMVCVRVIGVYRNV